MASIILKSKREGPLAYRHPWIFSGAIERIEGSPGMGETVEIRTADGKMQGLGAFSPHSQIAVRVWTFEADEEVAASFLRSRLLRAIESRQQNPTINGCNCGRLVFSESDGMPGVIIDKYADYLVCQFLSAGAEFWKETIVSLINDLVPCKGIYERSDSDVREKEGLSPRTGVLSGATPPDLVEIFDGSYRFLVNIKSGHKTGFYLDQWENRMQVAQYLRGRETLDCFCYTGGFAVAAMKGGANTVTCIDESSSALDLAKQNIVLNTLDDSKATIEEGNVSRVLRRYRDSGRQFDAIILDPPKFIRSRSQLEKASRGYKDINLMALKLLKSGGVLATFSCSQLMSADMFQKMIAFAAVDARRDVQILSRLSQAPDHPIALNFPESEYLKGLICRVL